MLLSFGVFTGFGHLAQLGEFREGVETEELLNAEVPPTDSDYYFPVEDLHSNLFCAECVLTLTHSDELDRQIIALVDPHGQLPVDFVALHRHVFRWGGFLWDWDGFDCLKRRIKLIFMG